MSQPRCHNHDETKQQRKNSFFNLVVTFKVMTGLTFRGRPIRLGSRKCFEQSASSSSSSSSSSPDMVKSFQDSLKRSASSSDKTVKPSPKKKTVTPRKRKVSTSATKCRGRTRSSCYQGGCTNVRRYTRKDKTPVKRSCRRSKRGVASYRRALPKTKKGIKGEIKRLRSRKSFKNAAHPDHTKASKRMDRLQKKLKTFD